MRQLVTFTALVVCALGVSSPGWTKGSSATPEMLEKGKTLYKTNCLACHGEKGDGNGPAGKMMQPKPREFKTADFKNGATLDGIKKSISEGLPGTAMVAFKNLSEDDRSNLAHYVLELRGK